MMLEVLPPDPNARKYRGSTPIIYVSLYFLLLAFFIFLHSISSPNEEKVQKVIGSIDFAFDGIKKNNKKNRSEELDGDHLGVAVFHSEIKRVYETAIPLIESKISKKGDQLQLVVPASQLFQKDSATLRSSRDELFEQAARILIKRSGVTPTDLEIIIDAGDKLPSKEEAGENLSAYRVNSLASAFFANGVPGRNVFVGMMSEGTNNIYFKFHIRTSFENQFRQSGTKN